MNFTATNDFLCPHCESVLNGASGARPQDKPTNGQWTICNECAGICIYVINENGVSLRKPTDKDLDEAKQVTAFWHDIEQMIEFVKSNPQKND